MKSTLLVATVKSEPLFEYEAPHLFGMDVGASSLLDRCARLLEWTPMTLYKLEMASKDAITTEKRKTMMASKDDNKHKYDNGNDNDDYSSEPEVFSEEVEMNLLTGSEEELLIRWGRSDDRDSSNSEKNSSIGNGRETSDDRDTSDDEE
jgi:hypothetical protein